MKMPGFTAEASLDGTSDRYRRMSISPVPTNGTGEARVVAALNPSSPLCRSWLGCCRHGVDSCCERYFDYCVFG